jgi:N-methylhydantoinase B/oxoprolinase/acetone carboxylase alpha subunit
MIETNKTFRRDGGREELTSKGNWQLEAGDRVRIETPGGGNFGKADGLD